jgi:hypothetical protein
MTAPQFFGALVRAIGVYLPTHGLGYLVSAMFPAKDYPVSLYVILGSVEVVLGIFLMFQADNVVEMCYSQSASQSLPESGDSAKS